MAYRLALDEGIAGSLREVARDQLEPAAEGLAEEDDRVEAVHDARKRIKKTRSALRLARPGMRKGDFRAENRALRDAGRALSGARDADVMVETIEKLGERYGAHIAAPAVAAVRNRLADRARKLRDDSGDAGAETLSALAASAEHWLVQGDERDVLVPGIRRTYSRGREEFARAERRPTAENLHEWRKRVKDLWDQERLLGEAWPGVVEAEAAEAKTLSKLLGDDHDLAVLAELLEAEPDLTADPAADRDELLRLIDRRRAELLDAAGALGRRVYAERPKAYARRLRRYL